MRSRFPRRAALPAVLMLAFALGPGALGEETRGGAEPFLGLGPLRAQVRADREPARLERLSGLGRVLLHTAPIAWGDLEPAPPRGAAPRYTWQVLDEAILVWQLAGFDPVLRLSPAGTWAGAPRAAARWVKRVEAELPKTEAAAAVRAATGVMPLRDDTWLHWERFVRDLVERYDADGTSDLPGLRRPVRYLQVLDRAADPGVFVGDDDEYLRLLHHAGLGARAACATCRLLATSVDVAGTGHEPHPDQREWDYRIGRLVPEDARLARLLVERRFRFARRLVASPHLYDILPQRGGDSLAEDVANLRFLRRHLDESGASDVGLWLVDNPSRKLGASKVPADVEPKKEEARLRNRALAAARNPAHPGHAAAAAWRRRGQAYDVVRALARSRAAGADAVLFLAPGDELPVGWPRRQEHGGLGFLVPTREGGLARAPSWYALRQARALLGGHRSAAETPIGAPGRSVTFHFDRKAARGPPWVSVLMLDPRLSWAGAPGEPLPGRDVLVALPNGRYVLESCRLGAAEPERRSVTVKDGSLAVKLTPAPLYVVPQR